LGIFAITGEIGLTTLFVDHVMLTRRVENWQASLLDKLIGGVELLVFGKVRHVAGMDHEGWLHWKRLYLGNCFSERSSRIRIGRLVEPDVAIANLNKSE